MNAAWKQSIPILTVAAPIGAQAGAIKPFALFSAIILLSFFVMVDFSTAAPAQKPAIRAPAAPAHTPAAPQSPQKFATPQAAANSLIKVITPQAGAFFSISTTKTIEWQYSNLAGTVRVLLYKGGAPTSVFPLASMALNNSGKGTCQWTIHPDLKPGNDYTIVIESNDKPGVKGVSAPFSISAPVSTIKQGATTAKAASPAVVDIKNMVKITKPHKFEEWSLGYENSPNRSFTVSWDVPANGSGDVNITLLKDSAVVQNIVNNYPIKNKSFKFTLAQSVVPDSREEDISRFRIQITPCANSKMHGLSDEFSIILHPPTISRVLIKPSHYYVDPKSMNNFQIPIEWWYTGFPGKTVKISFEGDTAKPGATEIGDFVIAEKAGIGHAQHNKYMWKVPADLFVKLKNAANHMHYMKGSIKVTGEKGSNAKDNIYIHWID